MDEATREKALGLLAEKRADPRTTYTGIEVETGYGKRQLVRLAERLDGDGADSTLVRGGTGR